MFECFSIQEYPRTSRTLCPAYHDSDESSEKESMIIMVSCASSENFIFSVFVDTTTFNIEYVCFVYSLT